MRRLPLVLALLLCVAGGIAYLLTRSDPTQTLDVPESTRSAAKIDVEPKVDPAAAVAARTAVETAPADEGPIPRSYLAALGGLTGRVVDHDGTPKRAMKVDLVGCNVLELFPAQDVSRFADDVPPLNVDAGVTTTGDDGRFRFETVDPRGFYMLAIDRSGPRSMWSPVLALPQAGETVDLGDVILQPFCTLTGTVLDEKGAAVAGARVRASGDVGEGFPYGIAKLCRGCAVTGQLPPEAKAVFPGIEGWPVIEVPPILIDLWERLPIPETKTKADGTFRLEGVALGRAWLAIDQPGYVELVRGPIPTASGGEKDIGKQTLLVGEELPIAVIDGADAPVVGAQVLVGEMFPFYPVALLVPVGETDAAGRVVARGLTDGRHVVAVRAKEASRWTVSDIVNPGLDEPVIRVENTFALRALVKAPDGTLAPGAKVAVIPETPLAEVPFLDSKVNLKGRTKTLDDGRVEVRGLSPGNYHVLAVADGYAIGRTKVTIGKESADVELVLKPEFSATIRVVTAKTEQPIEFALASVTTPNEEKMLELFTPPSVTRRTDKNGIAFLPHLAEGRQRVRVFHPLYAIDEFEVVVPGPPIVVHLKAGGSLRGHVTANGQPIAESHIVVVYPAGENALMLPRLTLTDAKGDFVITHLEEGAHKVNAFEKPKNGGMGGAPSGPAFNFRTKTHVTSSSKGDGGAEVGEDVDSSMSVNIGSDGNGSNDDDRAVEVMIREGEETWVDLDTKRSAITGKTGRVTGVVLVNGAPRPDMVVAARKKNGGGSDETRTDAQGRFDLANVPVGDVMITARSARENSAAFGMISVTLAQGEARDVQIAIETGSLSGRVRAAANGAPVSFAHVSLLGNDGDVSIPAATEQDGTFAFSDVPQGQYMVRIEHQGFAATDVFPVDVPGRGAATPLSVEMLSAVTVAGTVELPSGVTAPYLFVHLRKKGAKGGDESSTGLGSFGFVDPTSLTFEMADVAPGDYDAMVYGTQPEVGPVDVKVPVTGLSGFTLRPAAQGQPPR